jgi:protocatechuate 3,4-dioxygenase beta subunit
MSYSRTFPGSSPAVSARCRAGGRSGIAAALFVILCCPPVASVSAQQVSEATEPIVGLPCEGCEAVFDGIPDSLSAAGRIAPADEPGEPLLIEGTVFDEGGGPAAGIIVYAYHTNAHGVYPRDDRFSGMAARHGRLRGWVKTDAEGHYRFRTIRPASYPDGRTPAHVHMHVIEPGCCTYYISSIHFADDPRLTPEERADADEGRGGSGLVRPERNAVGVWLVRRDIVLGQGVPGYPRHDSD